MSIKVATKRELLVEILKELRAIRALLEADAAQHNPIVKFDRDVRDETIRNVTEMIEGRKAIEDLANQAILNPDGIKPRSYRDVAGNDKDTFTSDFFSSIFGLERWTKKDGKTSDDEAGQD